MEIEQVRIENGAIGVEIRKRKARFENPSGCSLRLLTLWRGSSHAAAWEFSRCDVGVLTLQRGSSHTVVWEFPHRSIRVLTL